MNRMVKKFMVVLLSAFMFLGAVTTPVQAKGRDSDPGNWGGLGGWFGSWWWTQPSEPAPEPEPEPSAETVADETPSEAEEPVVETVEEETPAVEVTEPVVEEIPAVEEESNVEEISDISEDASVEKNLYFAGDTYTVELIYGSDAQIPDDAYLDVREIMKGTEEYDEYYNQATAAVLAEQNGEQAKELTFARFFDIKIQTSEGLLEPGDTVRVKITYLDNPEIAPDDDVFAVHFPEEGDTEVIDTAVETFSTAEAVNGEAVEVAFDQGSFSVTGTVVAKLQNNWPDNGNYVLVVNKQGSSNYYAVSHSGTLLPVTYNSTDGTVTFESFLTTDEVGDYWWTLSDTGYSGYKRLNNSNVYINPRYSSGLRNSSNVYLYKTAEGYIQDYYADNYVTVDTSNLKIGGNGSSSNAAVFMFANTFKVDTEPAQPGEEDLGEPGHEKKLTDNKDGTYTLSLSVVGDSIAKDLSTKADVIVILDTSGSMRFDSKDRDVSNNQYNGYQDSRIYKARQALDVLADELLANNTEDHPDAIRLSLITFNTTSSDPSDLTDSKDDFMSGVPNVTSNQQVRNIQGGTNWEAALQKAAAVQTRTGAAKYVIFVSDGNPTYRNTRGSYSDLDYNADYYTYGVYGRGNDAYTESVARCYDHAKDDARNLVTSKCEFYTLGIFGNLDRMANLCAYAYNKNTYPENHHQTAADLNAMKAAFKNIVNEINKNFSYTGVSIEDGMTDMTAQTEIAGTAGNFQYTVTDKDGNEVTIDNLPEASFSNGKVVWSLGANYKLEKGYTYTVSFVVWPDQDAYDLVADLNNGLISYSQLTEKQKASIKNEEGVYSLKTNTEAKVKYKQITTTITPEGESSTTSDEKEADFKNPDPVGLKGTAITIQKEWADELQPSVVEGLIAAAEDKGEKFEITLDVMKGSDTDPYMTYTFAPQKDETTGKYTWPSQSLSIAPGVMVSEEKATASGLDKSKYTKVTGDDGKTYYLLDEGHDYSVVEREFSDYHFDFVPGHYHPMLVDGVLKNIEPVYSGETMTSFKVKEAELTTFKGTNTLRGGINLTKEVYNQDEKTSYDTDDKFVFEVTLTNEEGVFVGEHIPWYGVKYEGSDTYYYYHDEDGNYIPEGDDSNGNKPTVSSDNKKASFSIELGAKDSMRLNNVPLGSTYTIVEKTVKGYSLFGIDQITALNDGTEEKPGTGTVTLDSSKIEGTIVPNRANNITFKNKISDDAFYVYHSSDNTVEKVLFADSRVAKTVGDDENYTYAFNIVNETKQGHLYGGYYKGYGKTKSTDTEIIGLTYNQNDTAKYTYSTKSTASKLWAKDSKGTAYDGKTEEDKTVWNKDDANKGAYTVNGNKMPPEENKVYYLKEVPDVYLAPAVYVVYDTHDADDDGYYQIKKLYQMTATDDGNYKEVGFDIGTLKKINDTKDAHKADFCWGDKVTVTKPGAADVILEAGNIVSDHYGLIAGRNVTSDPNYIIQDAYFSEQPYHITPDNVKVTGVKRMIVYVRNTRWKNWTKPGMTKTILKSKAAYAAVTE